VSGASLPDGGDELPVLIGGSADEPERLALIGRPSGGIVRLREWTSADWASTPTLRESPTEALYQEIERAQREGRAVNQELAAIRRWLGIR
jgi:hypothetical protein